MTASLAHETRFLSLRRLAVGGRSRLVCFGAKCQAEAGGLNAASMDKAVPEFDGEMVDAMIAPGMRLFTVVVQPAAKARVSALETDLVMLLKLVLPVML